ncbi:MAG: hypothetical protein IJU78_00285 [Clostridia bacterium]|nr:hypothetical protein [Clostridia bacterium]
MKAIRKMLLGLTLVVFGGFIMHIGMVSAIFLVGGGIMLVGLFVSLFGFADYEPVETKPDVAPDAAEKE